MLSDRIQLYIWYYDSGLFVALHYVPIFINEWLEITLPRAFGSQISDVVLLLVSPPQREVNVNQSPAVSLNHNFHVCPVLHQMSWPSFGTQLSFYPSCQENTACQRPFPNFRTLSSVTKKKEIHTVSNLTEHAGPVFWKHVDSGENHCEKNEQQVWHSAALALHQQIGLTWQHSFCHFMVSKWVDAPRQWLAFPWHLIYWWQFVSSSTDCTASSQVLWPQSHRLLCTDCVYSRCKSIYRCRARLPLQHGAFPSTSLCSPPVSILPICIYCSGWQSSLVLNSHLLSTHPSSLPRGDYLSLAWRLTRLSHLDWETLNHRHNHFHQDMHARTKAVTSVFK